MLQKYKLDLRCSLFCSYLHQVHDLEFAQVEQEVVKGLQVGNASLKKMHEVCIILKKFLKDISLDINIIYIQLLDCHMTIWFSFCISSIFNYYTSSAHHLLIGDFLLCIHVIISVTHFSLIPANRISCHLVERQKPQIRLLDKERRGRS